MTNEQLWILCVIGFSLIGLAYVLYDWYKDQKKWKLKNKKEKKQSIDYSKLYQKRENSCCVVSAVETSTNQLFNKRRYKYTDSNITEEEQTYYGTPTYLRRVDAQVVLKLLEEATKIDFAD